MYCYTLKPRVLTLHLLNPVNTEWKGKHNMSKRLSVFHILRALFQNLKQTSKEIRKILNINTDQSSFASTLKIIQEQTAALQLLHLVSVLIYLEASAL